MAEPEAGAKVAKDLGIYLGQIYAYIKKGTVTNRKADGYPNGKGVIVDPDEVREAMSHSRRKSAGAGKGSGSRSKVSSRPTGSIAQEEAKARAKEVKKGFKDGQLISYHKGVTPNKDYGHSINVVNGHYGSRITYLSETDRYHAFATGALREWIAKDVAHIERPEGILGLIMYSWIANNQVELAASLEEWMESHDLVVSIPDPIMSEEVAQEVAEDDEEVLSGDDD